MVHPCTSSFGCRFLRVTRPSSFSTALASCFHVHTIPDAREARGNFFAFFSLPKSPDLNASTVKQVFHELQRRVHPDRANAQAKERAESAEHRESAAREWCGGPCADAQDSIYANAAYHTLRDPFLRCKYLSRLTRAEAAKGAPLSAAEEEALMHESDGAAGAALDEAFLMEMMEANEIIFSEKATEGEGLAALKGVRREMERRDELCYSEAKESWRRGDMCRFRQCVLEWTYIRNALQHAKDRIL